LTPENQTLYALLPSGASPKSISQVEFSQDQTDSKIRAGKRAAVARQRRPSLPFVEFRAVFKGGVLAERVANNGVTQLTSRMLLKGTSKRSAESIAKEIESVGGSIDSYGGNNSFGVNVELLSSDFALGLDLLADVVLNPSFPTAELERERQVQLAGIRAQKDQLLQSASRCMRRALFGDVAYGLDALGTESSVAHIQVADLQAFHAQHAVPNNCVLAIFGDIKPEQTKAAVESRFGQWRPLQAGTASNSDLKLKALDSISRVTETRDKKQAVLLIGFPRGHAPRPGAVSPRIVAGSLQRFGLAALCSNSR
jgi:zinc protease